MTSRDNILLIVIIIIKTTFPQGQPEHCCGAHFAQALSAGNSVWWLLARGGQAGQQCWGSLGKGQHRGRRDTQPGPVLIELMFPCCCTKNLVCKEQGSRFKGRWEPGRPGGTTATPVATAVKFCPSSSSPAARDDFGRQQHPRTPGAHQTLMSTFYSSR